MRRGRYGMYPGNGPFRDLPPYQRPGWVYGGGRGWGRAYTTDPTRCARFPWMPRWWWSNPDYQGQIPPYPTTSQEKEYLEDQKKFLEESITEIRKRLDELESQDKAD